MVEEIRAVMVEGPDGCKPQPVRGQDEVGSISDRVVIPGGEVWEIRWRDGTMDLWFHASDS